MPYYTSAHWLSTSWIDKMYQKYPNLHGIFSTENYWIWANDIENKAADYLKVSAKMEDILYGLNKIMVLQ